MSNESTPPPFDPWRQLEEVIDTLDDCAYELGRAAAGTGSYPVALVRYGLARRALRLWLAINPASGGGDSAVER